MDFYAVLGVDKNATAEEIKRSYRRLAKQYHPDKNPGNRKAEERFKEANHAFEVLSDPDKRKLYDEFGDLSTRPGFDAEKARAYRQWQSYAGGRGGRPNMRVEFGGGGPGFGGGFETDDAGGGFGDFFSQIFGGSGRAERQRRGADVATDLTISLDEAVHGGERELAVQLGDEIKRLRVKIPAGSEPGQTLRLAGQGRPGFGGAPGDLLITLRLAPHPHLSLEGRDLVMAVPVTIGEAWRGARIEVPTLGGQLKLTIPPGSQNGQRLRLRGKGLPARGERGAGDLYVVLDVRLPEHAEDPRIHAALDTLESAYGGDVRRGLRV